MTTVESDERAFQIAASSLIGSFFVLLKLALVHDMSNRAVGPSVVRFRMSIEQLQKVCGESAAIQFVSDGVYANQRLIRADLDVWEKARFIKEFFAQFNIAEIAFHGDVHENSIRDFISVARNIALKTRVQLSTLYGTFPGISFRDLDAVGVRKQEEALVLPDPVRVLRAFGVIVVTTRELMDSLRRDERAQLLPLRRAVQEFVRLPPRTRSLQLGLLSLEQYRRELPGRLARVGVTVVMMANRLGLKTGALRELGVSSVLSGVGRAFSDELALASLDRCSAEGLLVGGARRLAATSGVGQGTALRLIAATELAEEQGRRAGHPLTRLLAVAEAYEQLTAPAPHGEGARPHDALRQINASTDFDPIAARLLLSTLGLFPVGSMVRLSTGEMGIVTEGPSPGSVAEPQVLVISDAGGRPARSRTVNLAGAGIDIVGTVAAEELDLNVGHFLFA
jgi:hypothetical protein